MKPRLRLYSIWQNMRARCYSPKNSNYLHYGGRGINVCGEWTFSFKAFQKWAVGAGYSNDKQIDRIDNDGNYTPENCRWVTFHESSRNTSRNRWIEVHGETLCLQDAAMRFGVPFKTLKRRIFKQGMTPELAISLKPYESQSNAFLAKHGDKLK